MSPTAPARLPTLLGFRGGAKRFLIFPEVLQGAIHEATDLPLELLGVAAILGQRHPAELHGLPKHPVRLAGAEQLGHLRQRRRTLTLLHFDFGSGNLHHEIILPVVLALRRPELASVPIAATYRHKSAARKQLRGERPSSAAGPADATATLVKPTTAGLVGCNDSFGEFL